MYKKITLKNGLRIITIPMESTETVTVLVLVKTGSKYEQKNINGISHFLEHLFFKGTKKRPTAFEIAQTLDSIGGAYNAFTGKEYTGFWAKVTGQHLDLALDWLSDLLLNPRFREADIGREKGVIVEEIKMQRDVPMGYVADLWEMLLYKDQPAGWLIIGKEENISRVKRKDILDYFKSQYSAENTIVCVAGKIGPGVAKKIGQCFEEIEKAELNQKEKVVEVQKDPDALLYFKKTDQTHFCLGARGFDLLSPQRYIQMVLAVILGGNASSRLFISIRQKAGLAYYIHTSSGTYTDTGYLVTQAGVAHKNVKKAVGLILKEYRTMKEKRVTKEELQKAKDYLKGTMSLNLETSDAQASFYATQELLRREIITPHQLFEKIDKVTLNDIQEIAKAIFQPQKLNLALIGPFKEKKDFRKLLKI